MPDFIVTRRVTFEQTFIVKDVADARSAKRALRQADREGRDGCDDEDTVQAAELKVLSRSNIRTWEAVELE